MEEVDEFSPRLCLWNRSLFFGLARRFPLRQLPSIKRRRDERSNLPEVDVVGLSVTWMTVEDTALVHDDRECTPEIRSLPAVEQGKHGVFEFGISERKLFFSHFRALSCKMNLFILYY